MEERGKQMAGASIKGANNQKRILLNLTRAVLHTQASKRNSKEREKRRNRILKVREFEGTNSQLNNFDLNSQFN